MLSSCLTLRLICGCCLTWVVVWLSGACVPACCRPSVMTTYCISSSPNHPTHASLSPDFPSSPFIASSILLPCSGTGTLTGGFLPYDDSFFYVDSGDLADHTSFVLWPTALTVILGDLIIFHEDYAEYDSCFVDHLTGIWHSLILIIPYRVGVPILPSWSITHCRTWYRGFLSLADLDLPIIAGVHTHVTAVDYPEEDPDACGYFLYFYQVMRFD